MNGVCKNKLRLYKSNPIMIPKNTGTSTSTSTGTSTSTSTSASTKQKYYSKCSNISPNNDSPPNSWKLRLKIRLDTY